MKAIHSYSINNKYFIIHARVSLLVAPPIFYNGHCLFVYMISDSSLIVYQKAIYMWL